MHQTVSARTSRNNAKGRIVIAAPGQDGRNGGAKVIATALREVGYEVVCAGLDQPPDEIVAAVIAEDASILGMCIPSGVHMKLVARVIESLAQKGASDTAVVAWGLIPAEDAFALEILGARRAFVRGTTTEEILDAIDHLNAIYGSVFRAP